MLKDKKIYIAGHNGMVGSAIWRTLTAKGYTNLIGVSSKELDLKNQQAVSDFITKEQPDVIIDAAAKVGGILANNNFPYQFLMENMQIQNNLLDSAHQLGVDKFIFLGSSCIYPKMAPQPLKEEYLLTGGQIANIKKKLLVKSILDTKINKEDYLLTLCKDEFILNQNTRNPIGFLNQN